MTLAISRPAPSFPPVDALIDRLAAVDWPAAADRALMIALTVAAIVHALAARIAPHLARALRSAADRIDRLAVAPAAPAATARETVAQLRARARRAGLSRALYTSGRRADLIVALAQCAA